MHGEIPIGRTLSVIEAHLPTIGKCGFYPLGTSSLYQRCGKLGSFLQAVEEVQDDRIPHSTYLKSLKF